MWAVSTTGNQPISQEFQRRTRGGPGSASGRPRAAPGEPVENLNRGRSKCVLSGAVHPPRPLRIRRRFCCAHVHKKRAVHGRPGPSFLTQYNIGHYKQRMVSR